MGNFIYPQAGRGLVMEGLLESLISTENQLIMLQN